MEPERDYSRGYIHIPLMQRNEAHGAQLMSHALLNVIVCRNICFDITSRPSYGRKLLESTTRID